MRSPPVKERALDLGLTVEQPARIDESFAAALAAAEPEVCVVVAYGKILPRYLLEVPPLGFVNLHFSVLPHLRGAAPVQTAIIRGDTETGVSVMVLTEGMDEGPVLAAETTPIGPSETAGELGERLAGLGAPLLARSLEAYRVGTLTPVEQDHARATYAPKLTTDDVRIDWSATGETVLDLVRGASPAPGAWTTFRGGRLKVHSASKAPGGGRPGEVVDPVTAAVACGEGAVTLEVVQPAGKRPMTGAEFGRGARLAPGDIFV